MKIMANTQIEKNISDFRTRLLLKMPFYGEMLSRIDIVETGQFETACTNGRVIYYNRRFFEKLTRGQQNYVLMHELFHILLLHFRRDKAKEPEIWNVSADYVVNGLLEPLIRGRDRAGEDYGIEFEKPPMGCFLDHYHGESAEELYSKIYALNKKIKVRKVVLLLADDYSYFDDCNPRLEKLNHKDFDLTVELNERESMQVAGIIRKLVLEGEKKWSKDPSFQLIKRAISILKNEKRIPWKKLLIRFLKNTEDYEDVSYSTPERKYIHMDMILPGTGKITKRTELKGIWAFIDTSGSISEHEMNMFISELYHLCRMFDSELNVGFWDTEMHEVYRNVKPENLTDCTTQYRGGTDACAVYDYISKNNIKPRVMLILTDGCFDPVPHDKVRPYRDKTIIVLPGNLDDADEYMGKITKLG